MPKTEKKIIPKKNKPPFFFANYDQRSIHILKFDPVIKQKTLELWDFVISSAKRSTDLSEQIPDLPLPDFRSLLQRLAKVARILHENH
jgi:hypothetical protein